MDFFTTLKGNGAETVEITFLDLDVYIDNNGNGLASGRLQGDLSEQEYIDPLTAAKLAEASKLGLIASAGAMALNLGISLIFGGSISAMWTMINTI